MDNQDSGNGDPTPFSVLKGEEFSISKILSRDSSVSQSSRVYYRSTANEGVPFKWERQPGTPKNPPREEVIPPPTPPPAVQSLALPRPNVHDVDSKDSESWLFWFWKKILSKKVRVQKYDRRSIQRGCRRTRFNNSGNSNKVSSSDGDSDAEFVGWVHSHRGSKSSSYSSSSSSNGLPSDQTEGLRKGMPFCCSPWRM